MPARRVRYQTCGALAGDAEFATIDKLEILADPLSRSTVNTVSGQMGLITGRRWVHLSPAVAALLLPP